MEVFHKLINILTNSPVLAFPRSNYDEPFILDTDASDLAIGAELLQVQDGTERVIGYGSYVLSPAQRKYCTTRKELLAIVRFTRQFRHYLLGEKLYFRTDHGSLAWLMRFKLISGMLARWIEELSQYDMVILHRKGKTHTNADALSRIPSNGAFCDCYFAGCEPASLPCGGCKFCTKIHSQWAQFNEEVDDVLPLAVRTVQVNQPISNDSTAIIDNCPSNRPVSVKDSRLCSQSIAVNECKSETNREERCSMIRRVLDNDSISLATKYDKTELRKLQLDDPDLKNVILWLETGNKPPQDVIQILSPAAKYFWANASILDIKHLLKTVYCIINGTRVTFN